MWIMSLVCGMCVQSVWTLEMGYRLISGNRWNSTGVQLFMGHCNSEVGHKILFVWDWEDHLPVVFQCQLQSMSRSISVPHSISLCVHLSPFPHASDLPVNSQHCLACLIARPKMIKCAGVPPKYWCVRALHWCMGIEKEPKSIIYLVWSTWNLVVIIWKSGNNALSYNNLIRGCCFGCVHVRMLMPGKALLWRE